MQAVRTIDTEEAQPADPVGEAKGARFYRGWWVVSLGLLLQLFAAGPVYYAYGNYSVMFAQEFGASKTVINFAYTLIVFLGAVGAAPVGWLADRYPVRILCMIGVVGTGIGLALVGAATQMWQVTLVFGTLIATGDIFLGTVISNYLIAHWFERRRGMAIGLSIIGASMAAMLFPPLTGWLFQAVGWRTTFLLYGIGTFLLAVPVMLFAHLPSAIPAFERKPRSDHVEPHRLSFTALMRIPAFWIISTATGVMIGVNGSVMISMVPFATAEGYGSLDAAFLVSIVGGGAFAGKLMFGLIADRVDLRWALRAGLLIMASGVSLFLFPGSYVGLSVACLIFGLGLGGMIPVWGALVAQVFGLASCGSALGGTRAAMTPFSVACPLLVGQIVDRTGGYALAWMSFGAMLIAAFAMTFLAGDWARAADE